MAANDEANLVLYIDFDNLAVGARDAGMRLNINLLLQRLLEKGKVIVKKAYADWSHHKEYMADLHEAGIELIEIPAPRISGKNSADIRLVVDAMELCHSKSHIDTFVIASGDSDFSPLVAKLRENNKSVIGVGMRNSTAHLLVANCDDFIFYDDLVREPAPQPGENLSQVPAEKRHVFEFLMRTTRALMSEGRETLYSSLIKDAMKRKRPDFNQSNYGYGTFGDLLEDARTHGLLDFTRDESAGGTWVVTAVTAIKSEPRPHRKRPARRRPSAESKPAALAKPK
ncbi:MAG: NYN domain-containing protein [Candidatus Eisenbacteria bacterium]